MNVVSTKPGKAVVLMSGGLDSATCLAIANKQGFECYVLSFDYSQRHRSELKAAASLAQRMNVQEHKIIPIDMCAIGGSALTDINLVVPETHTEGIPITYVPARNTIFLAYALGWAEILGADAIFIGVNALDYSGYPDCRPEFIEAFREMANLATKVAIEGNKIRIETPLINLSKAEIIQQGVALGVDYSKTVSCYQADLDGRGCGRCESCRLRIKGFLDAGIEDPTFY